jgi:hypothetical protein
MNPQQSFFLTDDWHAIVTHCKQFCIKCSNMPFNYTCISTYKCITSYEDNCSIATGESNYPPSRLGRAGRIRYVGIPPTPTPKHSKFRPPDKRIQFNRMNGSPGDPPGSCKHLFTNERIVPSLIYLAGDPPGEGATMSKRQSISNISVHRLKPVYGNGLSTDAGTCKQITSTKLKE